MVKNVDWLLCISCILGTSSCAPVSNTPSRSLVTVSFNWNAWVTAAQADSAYLSVEGPLFRTTVGEPPAPRVETVNKRIDEKQYRGIVVYEAKDHTSPVMEVLVRGEENRVLLCATSRVAFVIEPSDYAGKRLTWIVAGREKPGPLDLPPGRHQIEIIGAYDRPHGSPK